MGSRMRPKLSYLAFVFIAMALISILFAVSQAMTPDQHSADAYWKPVEKAIGKNGTMLSGGVFKVDLTRSDKAVAIGDVRLKPHMAMDSWIAFMPMGDGATMMGGLTLTAGEMAPVQAKLSAAGIDITAVHNTLIGESPQVYDLHIGGRGDPVTLAAKVRSALDAARIPISIENPASVKPDMDPGPLNAILGYKGRSEGGIYLFTIPRAERITMDGMEMPASMDVATQIKFQPLGGGRAAATGDFLVRPNEVKPVIRALNANGIEVTALHTHMLTEEPRIFMLHFWATGDAKTIAQGIRLALDNTNSKKTQ